MAHNLLEGCAYQVGKTAVGGADFAVEGHGNQHVVKGIDQVPVTLLRLLDNREQLVQLLITWRVSDALFNAANQSAQLCDLFVAFPGVNDEGRYNNDQDRKQEFVAARNGPNGSPGNYNIRERQKAKQKVSEAPQMPLALLE